jgi:hypothetical protein
MAWWIEPATLSADIQGALAGGAVAAVLDKGSIARRMSNGVGAVAISVAMTGATVSLLTHWFPGAVDMKTAIAAIWAICGLVIAEAAQRVARRILHRSDDIGDAAVDKITGKKHD